MGMTVTVDDQSVVQSATFTKRCKQCNRALPFSAFFDSRSAKDGKEGRCKECRAFQKAERRKNAVNGGAPNVKRFGTMDKVLINDHATYEAQYTTAMNRLPKTYEAESRKSNILAAVALLLEMPNHDALTVIGMVQAYYAIGSKEQE